jgi:hypothetical protein
MLPLPDTRKDLGRWLKAQGYVTGAEIGVEQGKFAETLCQAGLELLCVDPWRAQPDYRTHLDQAAWDRLMVIACERLAPYPAAIVRATSIEAAQNVKDRSLDFVYIDGKHDFISVCEDIATWRPKVRKGGVLAGHDYQLEGVRGAVLACEFEPSFITAGDRSPSWVVRV